ncbi:hypothetical protein TIFTF001_028678 [Ficus carica]|uniref:Uncharacterized protein n=1 Tax=Ficus carica TaxID=3494 RepID=A0AA88J0F1_FICCA|nr:hypothetical protein TIFTF001_028678 [Ficus carica]
MISLAFSNGSAIFKHRAFSNGSAIFPIPCPPMTMLSQPTLPTKASLEDQPAGRDLHYHRRWWCDSFSPPACGFWNPSSKRPRAMPSVGMGSRGVSRGRCQSNLGGDGDGGDGS